MGMYSSLEGTANLDEVNGLPNVGQYGWTSFEIENYKQLIDYVDMVKKYADEVKASKDYIDSLMTVIDSIKLDIDSIYAKIQSDKVIIKQYYDTINSWYTKLSDIRDEIISYRNEVTLSVETNRQLSSQMSALHADVQVMKAAIDISERNAKTSETNSKTSETNALTYYNKCYELYLELKQGQVYRGIWNPNTGAYPNPEGMNSYWDVVLNAGQDEVSFDGKRWFFGDRLLYAVIDNTYYQSQSGATTVKSVNGKNGAVILNADDVKAFPSTAVSSLDEDAIPWNAKTGIYNARSDRHTRIVAHFFQGVASSTPSLQIKAKYNNQGLWYRSSRDAVGFEQTFTKIYTERDKPTPADIGAVSKTGDSMTGPLSISTPLSSRSYGIVVNRDEYPGIMWESNTLTDARTKVIEVNKEGAFNFITRDASGTNNGVIGLPKAVNGTIYTTGNKPTAADVNAVSRAGDSMYGCLTIDVPNTTYAMDLMGTSDTETKKYLRKFRSARPSTIWHETVTGSVYRLSCGREDSVHALTVDSARGELWVGGGKVYNTNNKPTAADVGAAPGGFGLGELARDTTAQSQDRAGFWRDVSATMAGITMPYDGTPSQAFIGVDILSGQLKYGLRSGGISVPINWRSVYSVNNKPTAADVNAADITSTASDIKILATANSNRAKEVKIYSKDNNLYTIGQDGTVAKFYNDRTYRPTAGDFGGLFVDNGNEVNFPMVAGKTELYFNYRQQGASAVDKIIFSNAKSQLTGRAEIHAKEFFAENDSKVYHEDNFKELPLPDVWIPLTNDLNLITGYGDEIQIGGYTVAHRVSFSRNSTATYVDKSGRLRVASINEPRFEKNGLLIEGSYTNLIENSSTVTTKHLYTDTGTTVPSPLKDGSTASVYTSESTTISGFLRFGNAIKATSEMSDARTSSCWVLSPDEDATVIIECEDVSPQSFDIKAGVWTRISSTRYQSRPIDSYINFFDVLLKNPRVGQKLVVWGGQLESSTAPTSLIITSGSSVTRQKDVASIPFDLNTSDEMTFAAEFNGGAYVPPYSNWLIDFASAGNTDRFAVSYNNSGQMFIEGCGVSTGVDGYAPGNRTVVACVWNKRKIYMYVNGKKTPIQTGTKDPVVASHRMIRLLHTYAEVVGNGSVRNLRIWHKALSDSELKRIN